MKPRPPMIRTLGFVSVLVGAGAVASIIAIVSIVGLKFKVCGSFWLSGLLNKGRLLGVCVV